MQALSITRAVFTVISAIATATGLTLDAIQVAGIDTRWWTLIAFGIFLFLVTWIVIELYVKNKEHEDKKPKIQISTKAVHDVLYLNVKNEGEKATFRIQVEIVYDSCGGSPKKYAGLWKNTNKDESEILKGQEDDIKLALIHISGNSHHLYLYLYDKISGRDSSMPSSGWTPTPNNVFIKPEYHLRVNISSDPSLKKGAFVKDYKVNLDGIAEVQETASKTSSL